MKGFSDVTPMITASGSYDSVTISILSYKMPIGLYKIQIFICMHYLWWASLHGHQYNMLVKTYLWNIKVKEPIIPCCQCWLSPCLTSVAVEQLPYLIIEIFSEPKFHIVFDLFIFLWFLTSQIVSVFKENCLFTDSSRCFLSL